eukprot:CAMPEP_0117443050 /NCGR_PEP_ID=MMETSP0759-20121206/4486_1 /TAXON_ID=63605 /ORGANISM="Percolomonas cosmopolitus, Strain WS" /LENGTH=280 /DNA_ID=CAMNT_0005234995 /DNA_START=256 /DNA_END=1098 /DNA_ORIENTATION=-
MPTTPSTNNSAESFTSLEELADDHIVTLNVGGIVYQTCVGTLRWTNDVIGPHFLRAMFTSSFDVKRDSNGHIFIDRNGKRFEWILDFLRNGARLPMPENPTERQHMKLEMEYFGLHLILNREMSISRDTTYQDDQFITKKAQSFKFYLKVPCKVQMKRWVLRVMNPFGIRVQHEDGFDVRFTSKEDEKTTSNRIIFKKWIGSPLRRNAFTHEAWRLILEPDVKYTVWLESLTANTPITTQSLKPEAPQDVEFVNNYPVNFEVDDSGFNGLLGIDFEVLEW